MSTRTLMSREEYLATGFEPDREWVDGEVVERNVGELPHGRVQGRLVFSVLPE